MTSLTRVTRTVALYVGLASVPGSVAARIVASSPETIPSSADCFYFTQTLAVLDDGSFAVGRLASCFNTGQPEVVFFRPSGTVVGPPVVLPFRDPNEILSIGSFGGQYLVTWSSINTGESLAAVFDSGGRQLGRWFSWPRTERDDAYRLFRYAVGPQGWALGFFTQVGGVDRFGRPLTVYSSREVGPPSGHFLGPSVLLTSRQSYFIPEDASINQRGRFVAVGVWCPLNPRSTRSCTASRQVFQSPWTPKSAVLTEGMPDLDRLTSPLSVTMRRNNSFGLAWSERFGDPPLHGRVMARFFEPNGAPMGPAVQVGGRQVFTGALPIIRALPYNSFAVVFLHLHATSPTVVQIREVDPSTGALGPLVLVDQVTVGPGYEFEVNAHGQGAVLVGNRITLLQFVPDDNSSTPEDGE